MDTKIQKLVKQIGFWKVKSRLLYNNGRLVSWSTLLLVPVPNYIESVAGPVPIRTVSAIDVEVVKIVRIGRLIKPKEISLTSEIIEYVKDMGFTYEENKDNYIRIFLGGSNVLVSSESVTE